jgi:hypothetical protein
MSGKSTSNLDRHVRNWPVVSTRIPPQEHEKLVSRYPERGKIARVLRALVQMHLSGQVKDLKFTITEDVS